MQWSDWSSDVCSSDLNVITIFGNCNVASRGIRRIQFTVQLLPAHRKTSYRNPQKGSVQLGIFSAKFAESTQTAQAMPNNRKSPTTSTTSTTTAASKKIPRLACASGQTCPIQSKTSPYSTEDNKLNSTPRTRTSKDYGQRWTTKDTTSRNWPHFSTNFKNLMRTWHQEWNT